MALLRQARPSSGSNLDPNCMEQEDAPLSQLQAQVCFHLVHKVLNEHIVHIVLYVSYI